MTSRFNITLNTFTPAEAAKLTGVSTAKQLDWRRRGLIPRHEGHARFNIFALAHLDLLRMASESRLLLERFAPAARQAAASVAYYTLFFADHYEGDEDVLEQFCVIENEPNRKVLQQLSTVDVDAIKRFMVVWAEPRHMGEELILGYSVIGYHDSLDEAFGELNPQDHDAYLQQRGPVHVFDLKCIGFDFGVRAPRPFVHVALADEPTDD